MIESPAIDDGVAERLPWAGLPAWRRDAEFPPLGPSQFPEPISLHRFSFFVRVPSVEF
jgi:hypothetical protein